MRNRYLLVFYLLFFSFYINAQSDPNLLVETNASGSLNLCGESEILTVRITNSSSSSTATNFSFESDLPLGITVVNSEYPNIGSEDFPIFELPDISPNTIFEFTYSIIGNCEVLQQFNSTLGDRTEFEVSNSNKITYSLNNIDPRSFSGNSESYNIRFAELEVKVADDDVNQFTGILEKDEDGTLFTREIEVRNSGLGILSEYTFYLDIDDRITFSELSLSNVALIPQSTAVSPKGIGFTRYTYIISDFSNIGNGNDLFEQNESMLFDDKVSLLFGQCESALETDYSVYWGCANTVCNLGDQEATSLAYLTFIAGRPRINIIQTSTIDSGSLCGDQIESNYVFSNVGAGSSNAASDSAFNLSLRSSNTPNVSIIYSINGVNLVDESTSATTFLFNFNNNPNFLTDPDGPGVGLEDLDMDGYFDDLPTGNSFTLNIVTTIIWDSTYADRTSTNILSPFMYYQDNECSPSTYGGNSIGSGYQFTVRNPSSASIPEELATNDTETLVFNVDRNVLRSYPFGFLLFGDFYSDFRLPQGYVINAVRWYPNFGTAFESLAFEDQGNNLYRVNGGAERGKFELDITVQCADGASEFGSVDWNMFLEACPESGSAETINVSKFSKPIFTSYEVCTPGGGGGTGSTCDFSIESFNVDRNTFGAVEPTLVRNSRIYYTKSEYENASRVNKDTPGIILDAAYPLDQLLVDASGKILASSTPINYDALFFEFAFYLPEGTTAEVFRHSIDNQLGQISIDGVAFALGTPEVSINATNKITFKYEVPYSFDTASEKSLLVSTLGLEVMSKSEIDLPLGAYNLSILRAKFYGRKTATSDLGCATGTKSTSFSVYIPDNRILNLSPQFQCDGRYPTNYFYTFSATQLDDFPLEFRPLALFDSYKVQVAENYQLSAAGVTMNGPFGEFPLTNITPFSGSEVEFTFDDAIILDADRQLQNQLIYNTIEPICDENFSIPSYGEARDYRVLSITRDLLNDVPPISSESTTARFYFDSPFTIEPNATQEGFERAVSWPILYCNEGNRTITSPWIALELKDNDTRTRLLGAQDEAGNELEVIFYGGSDASSARGMLVKVKSIGVSTCTTIYPRVTYFNCENDAVQNIDIISSRACNEYPLVGLDASELALIESIKDSGVLSCQYPIDEQEITLRYKTGDLTWEVNRLEDQVDMCEALSYEVKVVSSKFANVYDTDLTINLPQGISLDDINNIQYRYDGQQGLVDPTSFLVSTSGSLVVKVSDLVTDLLVTAGVSGIEAGESTIPGSRLLGKNQIVFTINFVADCTMDPGIPIQFNLDGVTNCNDNINLRFNRLFPINGLILPDLTAFVKASDFLVCNTQNEVEVNLINSSTVNDVAQQEILLTLPAGVSYGGAVSGFTAPTQTGNILKWNISDINKNQTFKVYTTLTNFNLTDFEYEVDVRQNGQAVCVVDQQTCNLIVTTAQDTDSANQITLPEVTITPITALPVCEGSQVVVSVALYGVTDYSDYTFNWNVAPTSINNNQFTFTLNNSTQLSVNVSPNGNNSSTCSGSASIDVDVYPGAIINMTLVEGVTCADQADAKATIMITGEANTGFVEQGPFEIVSASPSGVVTIGQQVASGELITIENLPLGPLNIAFRDAYGCTFEQELIIPFIANPITNFCTGLLACGVASGDVDMSFNTADLHSGLNGTPYSAKVINSQTGTALLSFTGTFPDNQTHTLTSVGTNLAYVLEITAENGCEYTRPFTIESYTVTAAISNTNNDPSFYELCFANDRRDIVVSIADNVPVCSSFTVPDYQVLFGTVDQDGAYEGSPQVFNGITNDINFTGLGVGNYKVTVKPSGVAGYEGEISLCEKIIAFNITSRANFTATLETTDPLCAGDASGSAEVILNGGTGAFVYEWKRQGGNEIISNGYNATGLVAGSYEVIVTDNNGCPNGIPLTFTINDPDPLEIPFIEDVQTACEAIAGSGNVTASGYSSGVAPYTFSWYEIVSITNDDGTIETAESLVYREIVSENGVSTFPGITPGFYRVKVKDANGCETQSAETEVTQPEVPRQYNIAMGWSSKAIIENEGTVPNTNTVKPIGPSSFKLAITSEIERCIARAQEIAMESFSSVLKSPEILRDTLKLAYVTGVSDVYHYTLYYYDRAGSLVRTVPPEGVRLAQDGDGNIARVPTNHTYVTGYDYNSISQLGKQNTPDGGTTNFLYNDIGQLLYSQNERQITDASFSYSLYDELGRILEAGEASLNGKIFPDDFLANGQADQAIAEAIPLTEKLEYIKTTFNDRAEIAYQGQAQRFLRNRVSYIYNLDKNGSETYTYYSYDPHGNVEWVVHQLPGIGQQSVAYSYDLISGNVNEVVYNKSKIDEYRHKYTYDEDNRIVSVKTSKDGYLWDEDARYDYYLHGPLARTEIGEDRIQGLDFTYTIHGWLKGINTPNLAQNAFNPDGTNVQGDGLAKHAKDEFGMALGYYEGDFAREGVFDTRLTASNPFVLENQVNGVSQNLYNGNISTWTAQTAGEAREKNVTSYLTGNAYQYDQLNRIKEATTKVFNEAGQGYAAINGNADAFRTNYSYDGNGNLQTLKRFKDDGQLMDDLAYNYDLTNPNLSNKLTHVNDAVGQISTEINDLPNQNDGNYEYDAIGQLVRDNSEGLTYVWNTSGKVSEIIPDNTGVTATQKVHMAFTYDGLGNRIVKQVNRLPYNTAGEGPQINDPLAAELTYYSLDAQGNVMGIYKREDTKVIPGDANNNVYKAIFKISERPIYGSDRVGQDTYEEEVFSALYNFTSEADYHAITLKAMETISSYALGNVLLAQNIDQELFDVDGNAITVEGTNLATAVVDGEFVDLQYNNTLVQDANSTPITTDNNIFVIEDVGENALGYGVVATSYFSGNAEDGVMLIYDTNGDLIPGLPLINADTADPIDALAKSVVVENPARANEYVLFYRDINSNLHTATLSTASGSLEVTAVEDLSFSGFGRHMAVVQDRKSQRAFVYGTIHSGAVIDVDGNETPPMANLVRFTLDETGSITYDGAITDSFEGYDLTGNGELQIALDGSRISVYNNTTLPTQWTGIARAEIRTWKLEEESWLPVATSVQALAIGSNIGKGSLLNTGTELFYTLRSQEVSTSTETRVIKRASDGQVLATNLGDLRANKNSKFYYFGADTDTGQEWNLLATNSEPLANLPASTNGVTGYQSYQAYTINGVTPAANNGLVYRFLGNKQYELKDHLGNVRVVVSDRKDLNTTDNTLNASVISYNNYYPFGMLQPNRNFNSPEYRYGFNGKEKDSELKGEGAQYDYGFRIYDTRLGKFLSQDPLFKTYPWLTPYQFASNSPIWAVDLDGLESKIVIHSKSGPPQVLERTTDNEGTEWQAQKASYYKAFANHENWVSGQDKYQSSTKNWSGPSDGTLTIDATGKVAKISYKEGGAMEKIGHSLSMGTKAIDGFFIHPSPTLERSEAFYETFWSYTTSVGAAPLEGIAAGVWAARSTAIVNAIQKHHIISEGLKRLAFVKKAFAGGYKHKFKPLEQFLTKNGLGTHAKHPKYTKQIEGYLEKLDISEFTSKQAKERLQKLENYIDKIIDKNPKTKLNDLNLKLDKFDASKF